MKLRLEVIWESEGEEQRRNVMAIERSQLAMETLGLNLGESKTLLDSVQDIVVAQQVAENLEERRRCSHCGERYANKCGGTKEVKTLFGRVKVANPRWNRCRCQPSGTKTVIFPLSGSDSGLVQGTWATERQKGAAERGAIQSQLDRTSAA